MLTNNKTLINRRESYRLWFEFYKISLLSTDSKIVRLVEKSRRSYYKWGDVKNSTFDSWWKTHDKDFEEDSVQVLSKDSSINFDDFVILQVPVNQSVSDLMKEIRPVFMSEHKKRIGSGKNKNRGTSTFQMTVGSEPKLKTIGHILTVYRDVYLKHQNVKGLKLLLLIHNYYKSRPKNKRIPSSLNFDSTIDSEKQRVTRNLRRWIEWGKQIQINVLNGEFPGEYSN